MRLGTLLALLLSAPGWGALRAQPALRPSAPGLSAAPASLSAAALPVAAALAVPAAPAAPALSAFPAEEAAPAQEAASAETGALPALTEAAARLAAGGDPEELSRELFSGHGRYRYAAAILDDPDAILRRRVDMIERAERAVFSSDFIMRGDVASYVKLALLREAARKGRDVRQLVDGLHDELSPGMIRHLLEEGVKLREFNPRGRGKLWDLVLRFHDKLLIRDGIEAVGGDSNSGREYLRWGKHKMRSRDIHVVGRAATKARHYYQQVWESDWVREPSVRVASEAEVRESWRAEDVRRARVSRLIRGVGLDLDAPRVLTRPLEMLATREQVERAALQLDRALAAYRAGKLPTKPGAAALPAPERVNKISFVHDPVGRKGRSPGTDRTMLRMIRRARKSLLISSPYFVLTPEVKRALSDAVVKRGVRVRVLTNSMNSSDNRMTQAAYELRKKEIAQVGVELWEYDGSLASGVRDTLHAKNVVVDGKLSYIGAYNVDYRSQKYNTEPGFVVEDKGFARRLTRTVLEDLERSTLVGHHGGLVVPERRFSAIERVKLALLESQL